MEARFLRIILVKPPRPRGPHGLGVHCGGAYCILSAGEPERFGIKAASAEGFPPADDDVIAKPLGNVICECRGHTRAPPLTFGEDGVFRLGWTARESLGLILAPVNRPFRWPSVSLLTWVCRVRLDPFVRREARSDCSA